jgi:WD40 repeat protein
MSIGPVPRVFLSYARKDGEAFATALRRRLATEHPDITLWQDRAQMEGGVGWWRQIEEALAQTKFLVIVMTPAAMASEMTRREWRHARQNGAFVYPVKGVPDSALDFSSLPNWMQKAHFFDIGRFADGEWRGEKEWDTFVAYLKSDHEPLRVPFMAPDLPPSIVQRPVQFDELLKLLIDPVRERPLAVTAALEGAGGFGKTTLALSLCHDPRIIEAFDDGVLWTSLGQKPRLLDELTRLVQAVTGRPMVFIDEAQAAHRLAETLEERQCLIVIDDLWERSHLKYFLQGAPRCARLITTRRSDLPGITSRVRVDRMSAAEGTRLLAAAFPSGTIDAASLELIVGRVEAWPLLLTLIAGVIQRRIGQGESEASAFAYMQRAFEKRGVTAFDRDDASERNEAVRYSVAMSLDQLPSADGERFRELAIFPESTSIPLDVLGRLWKFADLDDTSAAAQRLAAVSLITLDLGRGVVSIHDVLRDFLNREIADPSPLHARLIATYRDLLALPDTYSWRWLPYHLRHAGQSDQLRALLLSPRWLVAKARAVGPHALIGDFDLVDNDHDCATVQEALRLAMPALAEEADQLYEQLRGRLPVPAPPTLEAFQKRLVTEAPVPWLRSRWPNLGRAGGRQIQSLVHGSAVNGALPLADDRFLSWTHQGTLCTWDLTTAEGHPIAAHEGAVFGALRTRDGRILSWGRDRTLQVRNLERDDVRALTGHRDWINGVRLLADGRALSWSYDRTLSVWNLETGERTVLAGHGDSVDGALQLADGRVLSWSRDGTVRAWNLGSRHRLTLTEGTSRVNGATPLADGRVVSWNQDGTLTVWDLVKKRGHGLAGHKTAVDGVLPLADGRLLSWSHDGVARLWSLAAATESWELRGHKDAIAGALALPANRAVTWSRDRTLRVWDLGARESRVLAGHSGGVVGATILPGDYLLSWSSDSTLRIWNLDSGDSRSLRGHEAAIGGALPFPNGRALSWSRDGTVRIWALDHADAADGSERAGQVVDILRAPDGRALSWNDGDPQLRLWNVSTNESQLLAGHTKSIGGAQLLGDQRALSWGADGDLRVWDLATGDSRILRGHKESIGGPHITPLEDGRVVSSDVTDTLRLWTLDTGEGRIIATGEAIASVLPLPGGRLLSWSASHRFLRLTDLVVSESRLLSGHDHPIGGVELLPDGAVLSWSDDLSLRVWHLETSESRPLIGHTDIINGVLVLPNHRVLSWSRDRTIRIWDLATGASRVLTGHTRSINGVSMLPNGRVLSWSRDRTLRVWHLEMDDVVALSGHTHNVTNTLLLPSGEVLSWSSDVRRGGIIEDGSVRVWNLATATGRVLTRHAARVIDVKLLPDGRVMSWSNDRSLRVRRPESDDKELAYWFDATPVRVAVGPPPELLVGDSLGRVHALEFS